MDNSDKNGPRFNPTPDTENSKYHEMIIVEGAATSIPSDLHNREKENN